MAIRAVGVLSPGEMGQAVGAVLGAHGLRIATCLEGRSARTRSRAAAAGFEDLGSLEALVRSVDVLLCILVPSEALGVARRVAEAVRMTGANVLYVDCNAIAPRTARDVARVITAAGARFSDGGIIGPPPNRPGTRFYASGPGAAEFAELAAFGLDVRVLDGDVGQASGLKMCYAALTKGLQALGTELLVAARAMGLEAALRAEQQGSLADVLAYLERAVPSMPPKAHRWVGEMEEIAACFADLGLPPRMLLGAADIYRVVANTAIGRDSSATGDGNLDGVVVALAEALPEPAGVAEQPLTGTGAGG